MKSLIRRIGIRATFVAMAAAIPLPSAATEHIAGAVLGGGQPIAGATVSAWMAGPDAPRQLASGQSRDDGRFDLAVTGRRDDGGVLYLVAQAPNPALTLMTTLGALPEHPVTINELTTVASVWTAAQFLDGTTLSGNAVGLRIAAGNVPNLVDIASGGPGPVIQDPLNSAQTTTLAKFNTLGNLLAACTMAIPDACGQLFDLATPPGGAVPDDTLTALQNIARHPGHRAQQLFELFATLYPVPAKERWRPVPHIPYLAFAPRAWTLSLVYAGGGLHSPGAIAIDGGSNLWAGNNFLAGSQSTIYSSLGGGLSRLGPNGEPLSPMTTGFRGGGIDGPGFGIAIAADDRVWVSSRAGSNISVFDRKTGKPLSPETGYDFGGRLGSMQGIIVSPDGDVWALDNGHSQLVHLPQGDAARGRILGRSEDGMPGPGTLPLNRPYHLAIDQQDRIWVTNSGSGTVTRFPAGAPEQAVEFKVGLAPRAIAIDSQGNAWIANTVGHPGTVEKLASTKAQLAAEPRPLASPGPRAGNKANAWINLSSVLIENPGGDITMISPDGEVSPPFDANKTIVGPWGVAIDGNDHVWIANSTGRSVTQLCGARTETCPPGLATGDPISPATGYIGGLQIITGIAIDPAGNVWTANTWDRPDEGFKEAPGEALSTRFGGTGVVVFFGLAQPVKAPLIGPVRGW